MITLKDLNFNSHPNGRGLIASFQLENGIRLSVVKGEDFYSDDNTYEVAMFWQDDFVRLGAYDDVLGWQTEEEVNQLISDSQTDLNRFLEKAQERKEAESQSWTA